MDVHDHVEGLIAEVVPDESWPMDQEGGAMDVVYLNQSELVECWSKGDPAARMRFPLR